MSQVPVAKIAHPTLREFDLEVTPWYDSETKTAGVMVTQNSSEPVIIKFADAKKTGVFIPIAAYKQLGVALNQLGKVARSLGDSPIRVVRPS